MADEFISEVRNAIRNKAIRRRTPKRGSFSSVVNASGRLAESVRSEFTDHGVQVKALQYIDYVIFGRAPGGMPPVDKIQQWINSKGVNVGAWGTAKNIASHGTSIWQEHQGKNSGLLADIPLDDIIGRMREELTRHLIDFTRRRIFETAA